MSNYNNLKGEHLNWVNAIQKKDATYEDMMSIYEKWNTYDQVGGDVNVSWLIISEIL